MEWKVAPRCRVDLYFFTGLNCAGERHRVRITAVGGQQNKLPPGTYKSVLVTGNMGSRVTLMAYGPERPLSEQSWRTIRLKKGSTFNTQDGEPAVRIPHIDWMDAPNARRSDPDLQSGVEEATSINGGTSWTYGGYGARLLSEGIGYILVDHDGDAVEFEQAAAEEASAEAASAEAASAEAAAVAAAAVAETPAAEAPAAEAAPSSSSAVVEAVVVTDKA